MSERVKKIGEGRVEALFTVAKQDWKDAQERAFKKLAKEVTIKGFRKGQAPDHLVRGAIDPQKLFNEAVNEALPKAFSTLIQEENLQPFSQPSVEITKASNEELEIKFTMSLIPEVKLGQYKGLHAKKEAPSVKDEEVEEEIKRQLSQNALLEVVERAAKLGDTVNFDFKGFVDGKEFEGGSSENYSLELGSNTFVPGFEDGLVGVKAGEEKDVVVTFPTNYVKDLAGKEATFKCKINEVKEKKVPELNDETVKDLAIEGVETVDAFKEKITKDMLARKVGEANRKYFDDILNQIVAGASMTIAEEIIEEETKANEENLRKNVENQGLTFDQYLDITGTKLEDLKKNLREQSIQALKRFLALNQVGFDEKITVNEEETEAELQRMADQYKMKLEDVKKAIEPQINRLKEDLRNRKIQDFILKNND